tara:strand:- start:12 stop:239 length:228 start_codon:yes stop_codon:yes gene_type:complete
LTQDGTSKLIRNTLAAKSEVKKWKSVALVLANALAVLDFSDIEDDVEPYYSSEVLLRLIEDDKLKDIMVILKLGE